MCVFPTLLAAVLMLLCACDRMPTSDAANRDPGAPADSLWVRDHDSAHVTLSKQQMAEFSDSISAAQKSAQAAQQQFSAAIPAEQVRYAILWMAATADGAREFVWVRPVKWSPFRVEGVLLSEPVHELECGRLAGELVSFPVEDLADWVILDTTQAGKVDQGAATIRAIEQRIGAPNMNSP